MAKAHKSDDSISLNKFIRDSGLCSRREADEYIAQGRVMLNGQMATSGNRVSSSDEVTVDGERIRSKKRPVIIALNKPTKTIVIDESGKGNDLIKQIGYRERLFAVDPLDRSSEGLVLLTNDGTLASRLNKMTHLENEYTVSVDKAITDEALSQMSSGIRTGGKHFQPLKVTKSGPSTLKMILGQNQSKYVRAICLAMGYKLNRLRRTKIHTVAIKDMPLGQWKVLTAEERESLFAKAKSKSSFAPKSTKPKEGSFKNYRAKRKTSSKSKPKSNSSFAANRKRVKKKR